MCELSVLSPRMQVVLEFIGRPDVAQRIAEIEENNFAAGGWNIGQLLVKEKPEGMCRGVVVEVVCVGDNCVDKYAWPWVLWEGDTTAMCPNDEKHYLNYKVAYANNLSVSSGRFKITAEQLDAEWKAQREEEDVVLADTPFPAYGQRDDPASPFAFGLCQTAHDYRGTVSTVPNRLFPAQRLKQNGHRHRTINCALLRTHLV